MSLLTGLVSYWPMSVINGNPSTRYKDIHGTNHLEPVGGDAGTVGDVRMTSFLDHKPNRFNSATVYTTGNTVRCNVPSEIITTATEDGVFSLAGWALLRSRGQGQMFPGPQYYASNTDGGPGQTSTKGWMLYSNGNEFGQCYNFKMFGGTNGSLEIQDCGDSPGVNSWHHIVITYQAAEFSIYINDDSGSQDGPFPNTATLANCPYLYFGSHTNRAFAHGALLGWGLWSKILTGQERQWLYNLGNGRAYSEFGGFSPSSPGNDDPARDDWSDGANPTNLYAADEVAFGVAPPTPL